MKRRVKRKSFILSNINIFFTILVILEFIVTIGVASLIQLLLGSVFEIQVSTIEFIFIMAVILGGALAFLVNRYFFRPILKLSHGMKEVAKGDFSVKLETKSTINEVNEIYNSFDMMVRELAATEVLQTDFMSNVSHEIKTPVNAIEGYAMLLQGNEITPEEQEEYVEKILFNTKRLSELVGNVLLISKLDNQAISKNEKEFRMDEQIRQSIMQLETRWTEKNIELDVDLEKVSFVGNATLLIHVWDNLINNAIKFSPQGGEIKLKLRRNKRGVQFIISDEGPGIEDNALKHIFDKFYQADSSHKQEGNGLGLTLVKKIIDIYEGNVYVENLSEGGCRFLVELPME